MFFPSLMFLIGGIAAFAPDAINNLSYFCSSVFPSFSYFTALFSVSIDVTVAFFIQVASFFSMKSASTKLIPSTVLCSDITWCSIQREYMFSSFDITIIFTLLSNFLRVFIASTAAALAPIIT